MPLTRPAFPFASLALLGMTLSAPAAASMQQETPPPASAPVRVEAMPGDAKVRLKWSAVPGAEGYRIYQSVNGAWSATPVARTTLTTHTRDGLANGTTYSFTVAAFTKGGDGPLSLAVTAMPLSPPLDVKTTVGDRRVTLSWQPSAGATSYTIYRKAGNEPDFRELTTGVTAPPFVDPNLTNGIRYSYQLRAVTAAAESELSARVSAVPVAPTASRF
jgi:fibronectin type 3 domain-containing protein